jgi:hypothetical protein
LSDDSNKQGFDVSRDLQIVGNLLVKF